MDFELLRRCTKVIPRPDTFYEILREYYRKCSYFQYLSSYSKAPSWAKHFELEQLHVVDTEDLDLLFNKLNHPRELEVLSDLRGVIPDLPKITIGTQSFDSPMAEVLFVVSQFKELRTLEIVIEDSFKQGYNFVSFFTDLKSLIFRHWVNSRIDDRRDANWLLESIFVSCVNLTEVFLENVNFSEMACINLLKNEKLEDITFNNVKFDMDEKLLKYLFDSNQIKYICLREKHTTRNPFHYLATLIFLKNIRMESRIKTLKITVFSESAIQYENIRRLENLRRIIIYLPYQHTDATRSNFVTIIEA